MKFKYQMRTGGNHKCFSCSRISESKDAQFQVLLVEFHQGIAFKNTLKKMSIANNVQEKMGFEDIVLLEVYPVTRILVALPRSWKNMETHGRLTKTHGKT